jgi:hypothetical protein
MSWSFQMVKYQSLLEFLSGPEVGGIRIFRNQRDTVGASDLVAMDAGKWHLAKPFRAKLLRVDSGLCPDDAAGAAWEAGYFGDASDRPDLDTFLAAVRAELSGQSLYCTDDAAELYELEHENDSRGGFYGEEYADDVPGRVIPPAATALSGAAGVVYLYDVPFTTKKGRDGVSLYAKGFRPGERKPEFHRVFNDDATAREIAIAAFLAGEIVA